MKETVGIFQGVAGIVLTLLAQARLLSDGFLRGFAEFRKASADIARQIRGDDDGDGPCAA
jgi:hypothetical protein